MKTSYSKSPMYKTRAFARKKKQNVAVAVSPSHEIVAAAANVVSLKKPPKTTKSIKSNVVNESQNIRISLNSNQHAFSYLDEESNIDVSDHKFLEDGNHDKHLPIFLCEPFHTANLVVTENDINNLNDDPTNNDKSLSTNLLDFLLKYGIPLFKTEDILVPTTNIEWLLDLFNEKAQSNNPKDKAFVQKARGKYKQ